MLSRPLPATRDLVLLGGGHAHALVLRAWAMRPLAGARLTLVDPGPVAAYTGMLPGVIAGHYPSAALGIDLVRLAQAAGARLVIGRAEGLDPAAGTVTVPGRPPLAWDVLSLDIGVGSGLPGLAAGPGGPEIVAAKPMTDLIARWAAFLDRLAAGAASPRVAVIGGGLAGVELALAADHRLRDRPDRSVTLIEAGPTVAAAAGARAQARLSGELMRRGIAVRVGATVVAVEPGGLRLADGVVLPAAFVMVAAGARPQAWLAASGLPLEGGFVVTGPTLQVDGHPAIFAAGDCAVIAGAPRPRAGVHAVRQAPVLAANLRAALAGAGALGRHRPQRDHLKLVALGDRRALAAKWGLAPPLPAPAVWRWKDRIDRRFMAMLADLPAMPAPPLPRARAAGLAEALGDRPLCGGCGAKLGPELLRRALAGLAPGAAEGLGDDAAVLTLGGETWVVATDHLRTPVPDPWLAGRIAAAHALGDIHAMGARPRWALAQVILPPLAEPLQARTLAEAMDGIAAGLAAAGARLIGGHSTQGAELTLGLTVLGRAGPRVLAKTGGQPGDALVLTAPLGSGTILAAAMAGAAPGPAVAGLWAGIARDQGAAAALLAPAARALTDVTGFGLAGHLDEMLRADPRLGAELDLAALPLWDGAEALAAAGWASTVAPANRAALLGRLDASPGARAALLVDPQTCGGLLAAVSGGAAEALVAALAAAGYTAATVGRLVPRAAGAPAIRAR